MGCSYAELAMAVREAGAGLSARGSAPGDVLALCAPNCIEFAVAWYRGRIDRRDSHDREPAVHGG